MNDVALIAFQMYQPCSEVVSQLPVEFEILVHGKAYTQVERNALKYDILGAGVASQSPCTLHRPLASVFGAVAVKVVRVSDLSWPLQSLTPPWTPIQSRRSIPDLCGSREMDSFDQCGSPLRSHAVSGALGYWYLKLLHPKSCAYSC